MSSTNSQQAAASVQPLYLRRRKSYLYPAQINIFLLKGLTYMNQWMKKLAAMALLGMALSGTFGCAYGGIATAPDGTVLVARNDLILFGLLRKMYTCRPGPTGLVCTEMQTIP